MVISEQGERKKAFYVLQRFYEKKSQDQNVESRWSILPEIKRIFAIFE
jgi:hypothetical protein